MSNKITMDMLEDLNKALIISNSGIRLDSLGLDTIKGRCVKIKLKDDVYIRKAIIHPNDFFYEMIDTYFNGENITVIFNDDYSVFWAKK